MIPFKEITIWFAVPLGHLPGDYAMLYSNNGSGDISWTSPFDSEKLDLFPGAAGNYGWGMSPWGMSSFGLPCPKDVQGWGQTPWGMSPWGCGCIVVTRTVRVTECGTWKFALKGFDAIGNAHAGTPNEATVTIHVAPPRPQMLAKKSYDKDTNVLTLEVLDVTAVGFRPQPTSRIFDLTGSPFEGFTGRIEGPSGTGDTWTDPAFGSRTEIPA
jgi:hypothetical protein